MRVISTDINDVVLIEHPVYVDDRGFFTELYTKQEFNIAGIKDNFVQDNLSHSVQRVLRGLHYQICQPQGKLVTVTQGEVLDVAVDIRKSSPTFGKYVSKILDNKHSLWIPVGFAHGFYTLTKTADVLYKLTNYYSPFCERSIRWNDSDLHINWNFNNDLESFAPILSEKDSVAPWLKDAELFD